MGMAIFAIVIGLLSFLLATKYFVYNNNEKNKDAKLMSKKTPYFITALSILGIAIFILLFAFGVKLNMLSISDLA